MTQIIPVTMMMAITIDGKIAKNNTHFPNWTSKEDKKIFAKISKQHKVIIMGEKTFLTFSTPLKDRLNFIFSFKKNKISNNNIVYFSGNPIDALKKIKNMGYKSALLGGGAVINSLFLKYKLINEIILTIEPKIFGKGISLFNEENEINLKLKEVLKINKNSILIKYNVNYD